MEKELKTKLGIAYDLETVSIFNSATESTIEVGATTQEGTEYFYIKLKNYGELTTEDSFTYDDLDLSKVEEWVNKSVVGFIASELAKICLTNSWRFTIDMTYGISVTILTYENCELTGSFKASGEEDIYSLIYKFKFN